MIVDPDEPLGDEDFADALATARRGDLLDWPFPDDVLAALDAVAADPTDEHVAAARAAWSRSRA